jgi:4-hydroxyphenylpyruvate dioxygenase-like putative hemolysin
MATKFVNHIDHMAWTVFPENLEKYVAQFTKLFDCKFDGPFERDDLRIYISWEGGLELIAPLNENAITYKRLKEKGEGFGGMVFGVRNLKEAKERAAALGYNVSEDILQIGGEPWGRKMPHIAEAIVGDVLGINICFGEIVYDDNVVTIDKV